MKNKDNKSKDRPFSNREELVEYVRKALRNAMRRNGGNDNARRQ